MSNIKNPEIWIENIGEIMLSEEEEFFWMLPEIFVFTYESCVASPYFSFDQEQWRLVMMPSDGTKSVLKNNGWYGIFLWLKGCHTLTQKYNIRLSIKTPRGKEICSHNGELDSYYGFGKWNFLQISTAESNTLSGRIQICCVIQRNEENLNDLFLGSEGDLEENQLETMNLIDAKQKSAFESNGVHVLIENLKNLLNYDTGDVILKTNDHEFCAHRVILSARSPVFASMFLHDMEEKKTGEVDISDCSTAGFSIFLQYLYSGNVDSMFPTNVLDLYYIADKYQVADLKADCVNYIRSSLAIYNICDIMTLCYKHNEPELQNFATRFFFKHIKRIVKTAQWQLYVAENPIQANELFMKAINA